MVAIFKYTYTQTTEILWRKRGCVATLQVKERALRLPPGQAFIGFLGIVHQGWSSFTMHRFAAGYLLQITKERILLITSKRRMLQIKGESG